MTWDYTKLNRALRKAHIGKQTPKAFYVHRGTLGMLPAYLRELVDAADRVVGREGNVIKFDKDQPRVSLLTYQSFYRHAHPALLKSVTVHLDSRPELVTTRDYVKSTNRPILHRKEQLVSKGTHGYRSWSSLTKQEEEAGLLGRGDIGRERQWWRLLHDRGWDIRGHKLIRAH